MPRNISNFAQCIPGYLLELIAQWNSCCSIMFSFAHRESVLGYACGECVCLYIVDLQVPYDTQPNWSLNGPHRTELDNDMHIGHYKANYIAQTRFISLHSCCPTLRVLQLNIPYANYTQSPPPSCTPHSVKSGVLSRSLCAFRNYSHRLIRHLGSIKFCNTSR